MPPLPEKVSSNPDRLWRPDPGTVVAVIRDAARQRWLRFHNPVAIVAAHHPNDVLNALRTTETHLRANHHFAVGFLAYEAAGGLDPARIVHPHAPSFPLVWFAFFEKAIPVPDAVVRAAARPHPAIWTPNVTPDHYRKAIRAVRAQIQAGNTYQVNYTIRLHAPEPDDAWGLFAQLARAQAPSYGAFLQTPEWTLCSASPELFFRRRGSWLEMRPMKGTAARGRGRAEDLRRAAALRRSVKNRAENIMIVDMARNDLGRIAETGSVHVPRRFEIEPYPNVWQMTTTVRARTQAGLTDILQALFPCASITGAPKISTMRIIHALEPTPRGIYTGTIGFCAPNGDACFNVAIRTVQIDHGQHQACYGVGGGIVWDSRGGSELEECRQKASILLDPVVDFDLLETMRWTPEGGLFLGQRHWRRLRASAAYFNFRVDWKSLRRRLNNAIRTAPPGPLRIRLQVPDQAAPRIQVAPLEPVPEIVRVALAKNPVSSTNRFLFHKTTHRTVYDTARTETPGVDDVLLWNQAGFLTEATIANLAVRRNGAWHTPPLDGGLLAGTYRAELLRRGCLRETRLSADDLENADGLALFNSVRGARAAVLPVGKPVTTAAHLAELNLFQTPASSHGRPREPA